MLFSRHGVDSCMHYHSRKQLRFRQTVFFICTMPTYTTQLRTGCKIISIDKSIISADKKLSIRYRHKAIDDFQIDGADFFHLMTIDDGESVPQKDQALVTIGKLNLH